MKKIISVFAITSVVAVGLYLYPKISTDKNGTENISPDPATISEPLNNETVVKGESPKGDSEAEALLPPKELEENQEIDKNQPAIATNNAEGEEEDKPLPDLESFEGLEEESSNLFDGVNNLLQTDDSDPIKDVLE